MISPNSGLNFQRIKKLRIHRFSYLSVIAILILGIVNNGCGTPRPWYAKSLRKNLQLGESISSEKGDFALFLIGDCGKVPEGKNLPIFDELTKQLENADKESAILYLGDNIYEYGMTAENAPDRKEMERRMSAQLEPSQNFKGRVVVIPGNHDWAQGKSEGLESLHREEAFVEALLDRGTEAFLPDNGCPGPIELHLTTDKVLLIFDSQWWLHKHEKPGKNEGCAAGNDEEFIENFEQALSRNQGKQIIVAGHHPLHSFGPHGGHYHPIAHLFPLTMFKHNLYVPLPVLGTIAVVYRKYIGNIQDIPNGRYSDLQKRLDAIFEAHPGLIYVSGHDHNLQYLQRENLHYIVSGSGTKSTYVGHGKQAVFTDAEQGFAKLTFRANGETWLEFWAENTKTHLVELRFQQRIQGLDAFKL